MILSLLFLGLFAFSQAQTCMPETQPIGSFGQGVPRIDGTMVQEGSPYSMIDIDGAAQMPPGVITGLEYRVFRLDRVTFQVWKPLDIVQGQFELIDTVELNPTQVEEVTEVKGLHIPVGNKYRWGFSYNGNGNVPVKYSIALNEPNKEPYMALQCFDCAAGKTVGDVATFPTGKVQKQFRMRAMMSIVVSTCPPPTSAPVECIPPERQVAPESHLHDKVFKNYNPNVRPATRGENLEVSLQIRPVQIISFDGKTLKIFFFMEQRWRDNHLGWCPEDNDMISNLKVKPNEIWTPDISPYSAFQPIGSSGNKLMATLNSDGSIMNLPAYVWDLQCTMTAETDEIKDFKCSTAFGSWVHDGAEIDFKVEGEVDLSLLAENPKFEVMSATMVRDDVIYPCCPDTPYPTLYFNVMLRYNKMDKDMNKDRNHDMDGGM